MKNFPAGNYVYYVDMRLHYIITGLLICMCSLTHAQEINNLLDYKNINSDRYFRLNYENDFFSATDEYYTQGINLEMVSPAMKKNPLSLILIHPHYSHIRYGLALEHNGYTPSDIGHNEVLYGDRPFAGMLALKSFLIAIDTESKQRWSTQLTTGVIGPLAGAGQMQRSIHKWLNNITPHGWDNQIQNDIALNYEINYEKQLLSIGKFLSFSGDATVRVGTLSDRAGVGATLMFGYFDSPFSGEHTKGSSFRIYAYEHPEFHAVAYDAMLQGGIFDKASTYVIKPEQMNSFTFQNRFGFVVTYLGFHLEYFLSVRSRDFETQKMHTWGGVQIAFKL